MQEKQPEKPLFRQLLEASSVGIHLVASTFIGLAVGYALDKLFGTSPYLTVIFLIIGIIAGFRELVRVARKQEK
ncbi:MAG: AtpZ/AtpI family protein [Nitrospirae bacterium]|nr:AtpZ/AtpI family protein [Nitrospirota bacterium]